MIEAAAQRVDVGSKVDRLGVARLLGGHVQRCAHPGTALCHRHVLVGRLGQPEVGHLDLPAFGHQHVVRLDVSVDQFGLMCVPQGFCTEDGHQHRIGDTQVSQLVDPVLHALTVDEFDRHVVTSLIGFDGVHLEHVGVVKPGHRAGFAKESLDERLLLSQLLGEHLEGDVAIESLLTSQVHLAHPTLAELLQQFEVAEF